MNHDPIEIGHLIGIDLTLEICLNESASLNLMWSFFPVRSPGDFKALRTSDVPAISLLASCLLAHRFYAAWRTSCAPEISKNETSFFAITVTTSNSEFAVNKALYIYNFNYYKLHLTSTDCSIPKDLGSPPRWRHAGPRDATIGVWEHFASGPVAAGEKRLFKHKARRSWWLDVVRIP